MSIEIASNSVVVLDGAGAACLARIWASRSGSPESRALVIAACRRECGRMWRGMPVRLSRFARLSVDVIDAICRWYLDPAYRADLTEVWPANGHVLPEP